MMEPGSTARGTVRRRDGLVTLWCSAAPPSTGEWLYTGRLSPDGALYGHWIARPHQPTEFAETIQWEGGFHMQKRP